MALTEQIDEFSFLDLRGPVQLPREETEILRRPGVAGVGLKLTGIRGKPFTLQSIVDTADLPSAEPLFQDYLALVGGPAVPVIQHSIAFVDFGLGFLVLDVERLLVRKTFFLVGGINAPSLGWLEARWTLCAVFVDQTGGDE